MIEAAQTTQPNRAMRRAARKAKRNEVVQVPEPKIIDKWRIFEATDRILQALESGEVTVKNNKPIFMGSTGEICYIVPALEGWVTYWNHAKTKLGLLEDTAAPFDAIRKRLAHDVILTPTMLEKAKAALAQQKQIYDTTNRDTLASIANDVRIKLYMEG